MSQDNRLSASSQQVAEMHSLEKESGSSAQSPTENSVLNNSPFMKACRLEKTSHTPVWLMRQAGRYMKEFREIRSRVSLLELCKTPELACEVTVHAQETLGVDAAIIFSDILVPLDALGVGLDYVKGEGPVIARPLREERQLEQLPELDAAESLSYVLEAIRQTRAALKPNIPLIGFAACPFTLASYLIEGGSSRNYENAKTMMYSRPDMWERLMEKLVKLSVDYLNAQVDAGAQALQVFDSWMGCLSIADYQKFALPYSRKLIAGLNKRVPVIHFGTGNSTLLDSMKSAGSDVIGLDWRVDLAKKWDELGAVAVQGNLDPCVLFADKAYLKDEVLRILKSVEGRPGHIFNLGHGVLPQTNVENVKYLVELVHEFTENDGRSS